MFRRFPNFLACISAGPDRPRQDFEAPVNRSNAEPFLGNRSNAEPFPGNRSNDEPSTMSAMQPLQSVPIAQHINEPSTGVMTPLGGTSQGTLKQCIY